MTRTGATSFKAKQSGDTMIATTSVLAKKTRDSPIAGDNRACSNGRS